MGSARFSVHQQAHSLVACFCLKRRMAGEQLVKYCAKPVDVCRTGDSRVVSHSLFRGHVTRRAHHFERTGYGAFHFEQSGKAEVGEMRFAIFIEQIFPGLMSRWTMPCSCA